MVSCHRDTTYCASPNCQNKCGRKAPQTLFLEVGDNYIWWAYFCDDKGEVLDQQTIRIKDE